MSESESPDQRFPENADQFRAFMDNSPILAWAKDQLGRYVYLNKTYKHSFPDRLANWAGKTDFEIWSAETASHFRENDRVGLRTPGSGQCRREPHHFRWRQHPT